MNTRSSAFHFKAFHFCWAALHPNPSGIVVFIGGAFFGSYPTLFYRSYLESLYNHGYTIVALPFRFSFRHWDIATSLVAYQNELKIELLEEARRLRFSDAIYQQNPMAKTFNWVWIGHSLGCKYISLLELLSDLEIPSLRDDLCSCIGLEGSEAVLSLLQATSLSHQTLLNQPSLLLDPVLSDLENAIPWKLLEGLLRQWVAVRPSRKESLCIISKSRLFNLTSLISFESQLSKQTVAGLDAIFGSRLVGFTRLALMNHLAILGWKRENQEIVEATIAGLDRLVAVQGAMIHGPS